jgi:monofunctional biosynthetic peptidoglycan transglycosylase
VRPVEEAGRVLRKGLRKVWSAVHSFGTRIPGKGSPRLRIVLALLLSPLVLLVLWLLLLPWTFALRWREPTRTSFMDYRIEEADRAGREYSVRQEWLPLQKISPDLRRMVLVAEDDRFYQHRGIDWRSLAEEVHYQGDTAFSWWSGDDRRALWEALSYLRTHRSEIKGRSTITQQLAKNLYFSPKRSFVRKLNEAVVAKRLELFLPKDRILELYLNVAEWGPGIFGAEAAARAYFGTGAGDLTLGQAAALAATLPHPLTSNPSYRPAQMEWRRDLLLDRLRSPTPPRPPEVRIPVLPDTSTLPGDTISRIAG